MELKDDPPVVYGSWSLNIFEEKIFIIMGVTVCMGKSNERISTELRILGDNPYIVEGRDPLGFDDFVNSLVDIILNSKEATPFTIGLLGGWGTGKTTMMKRIQKTLEKEKCLTVWFNPWKYTEKEEVQRGLIKTIFDKIPKNVLNNMKRNWKKITIIGMDNFLQWLRVGRVVSEIKGIFELDTRFINEFETIMENMIGELLKEEKKVLLVIFIDDLDRCRPECAIKIFEAIKLYLCIPNCVFIVGFDRDVIDKGIEVIYGKDSKVSGTEYIKKIVQLPFGVPKPGKEEIDNYTEVCIEELGVKEIFSESNKIKTEYITTIVQGTDSNPRDIKRFLNSFVLLHNVKKDKISNYDPKKLIYILLIQLRWPHLFRMIDRNRTVIMKFRKYLKGDKKIKERLKDELKLLLEEREFLKFAEENIPTFKNLNELGKYLEHSMVSKIEKNGIITEEKIPIINSYYEEYFEAMMTKEKFVNLIKEKIESVSGLLTVQGAIAIIAAEHRIDLSISRKQIILEKNKNSKNI